MNTLSVGLRLSIALCLVAVPAFAQFDTTPPSLTAFDFNPKTLDASAGPAVVTCSISLQDVPSGVDHAACQFDSASNAQRHSCWAYAPSSGNIFNGVWACDVTIPQYAEEGSWTAQVWFGDEAGNSGAYDASQLAAAGFPTVLTVTSVGDTAPPELVAFDFNPKTLDASAGPAVVTCSISLQDDPSGVDHAACQFDSASNAQRHSCWAYAPSSGNSSNGVWACDVTFPQYAEEGSWTAQIWFGDEAGNTGAYDAQQLRDSDFPVMLHVGFLPGAPKAVISAPKSGRRVRGNGLTVRAELSQGAPGDVSPTAGVRFDFRVLPLGTFQQVPARDPQHPNPDTSYPYFIHWDVSEVADGEYELRAVAHDLAGTPDSTPEPISFTVDHGGPADVDENVNEEGRQESQTSVDDAVESTAASGDRTEASAATKLTIPAGALAGPVDRARLYYTNPVLEAAKLEQQEQSLGIFVEVSLESGQSTLENGLASGLNITYSDSDQDGVVDGTSVREDEIEFRRYDLDSDSYLTVPGAVMTEHNMVHTDTKVTGRFALTGPQLPKVKFRSDRQTLEWDSMTSAVAYNVYRGNLGDLIDGDANGLPDQGYGDCQNHRDPILADTTFLDEQVPESPGAGFIYLVAFENGSKESSLGNTSRGLRRAVFSACP